MATIKPIEGRSIHQIQSGQVIVDLCSVVKELVENSLDAGTTSLDVRFKNNGLDSIEVQDNGAGISPDDYETIALKHYTSKLSTYDDLSSLDTFGFRGEALSSLCALSKFHITTAQDGEAPKGKKLEFELSGKLKGTTIAATPKGTTVSVEDLFYNLPVRRRELEKNIKREYGKVLNVLHAYACIQTNIKFTVTNQPAKGKKIVVFSTKSNPTTKENISNVYGAKTTLSLIPLDLKFELQPTTTSQILKDTQGVDDDTSREVHIVGHISRPVFGEGRQTPDRQMFFINSRPCTLPQIAKAFNEGYKSYNVTQSPFIFADLKIDTNAYDVNVSPDKKTILLHDQAALLDSLKQELTNMFEAQEQTVPQSQLPIPKQPVYKPLTIIRDQSTPSRDGNIEQPPAVSRDEIVPPTAGESAATGSSMTDQSELGTPVNFIEKFAARDVENRHQQYERPQSRGSNDGNGPSKDKQRLAARLERQGQSESTASETLLENVTDDSTTPVGTVQVPRIVQDFNGRIASQQAKDGRRQRSNSAELIQEDIPSTSNTPHRPPGLVESVFNNARPKRAPLETASITIGDKTTTTTIGSQSNKRRKIGGEATIRSANRESVSHFSSTLQAFAAPGTHNNKVTRGNELSDEDSEVDEDVESVDDVEHETPDRSPVDEDLQDLDKDHRTNGAETNVEDSDDEYIDEDEKKQREESRVQELILKAEASAAQPTDENRNRASSLLKGVLRKDATVSLTKSLRTSINKITRQSRQLDDLLENYATVDEADDDGPDPTRSSKQTEEERLSLTISKSDFASMRIAGQFNLGFILAVRSSQLAPSDRNSQTSTRPSKDDLFIIDQHASDEIYNFSRLSATTNFPPQPLVRPVTLDLTAIEEEIILTHKNGAILQNGFVISIDTSGDRPVGRRCDLRALPTSKETVFDARDLEELLSILAEHPVSSSGGTKNLPRPSKHRRTLAMRACRSSIMVGKELSRNMMERVVRQMGEIDRPWNCPHGRPTMRHLAGLGAWKPWNEGDGLVDGDECSGDVDWAAYVDAAADRGVRGPCEGPDDNDDDVEDSDDDDDDEYDEHGEEQDATGPQDDLNHATEEPDFEDFEDA